MFRPVGSRAQCVHLEHAFELAEAVVHQRPDALAIQEAHDYLLLRSGGLRISVDLRIAGLGLEHNEVLESGLEDLDQARVAGQRPEPEAVSFQLREVQVPLDNLAIGEMNCHQLL
jgi:hypothetical protein